jgi:hypothetical protein
MITKRGRKRKSEPYFGPEEEAAVVKFLESRYLEKLNLEKNKTITITHNLGTNVIVSVSHIVPNENAYGKDDKFFEIDLEVTTTNFTEKSVDIVYGESIDDVTIIIVNETERDYIFNGWLKAPLTKMIDSIIRRYKLYRKGETFEELHGDAFSFLLTKVHKFDVKQGKKAYSYFGTIIKHYVLGLIEKDTILAKKTSSYEDMSEDISEMENLTYNIDDEGFALDDFIKNLISGLKDELDDSDLPIKKKLTENEKKVGLSLIDILENWETSFESMKGSSKYNKNSVLETIRNYTNLSTKDIRQANERFINLYKVLKNVSL